MLNDRSAQDGAKDKKENGEEIYPEVCAAFAKNGEGKAGAD
jgi:hypothetical protein